MALGRGKSPQRVAVRVGEPVHGGPGPLLGQVRDRLGPAVVVHVPARVRRIVAPALGRETLARVRAGGHARPRQLVRVGPELDLRLPLVVVVARRRVAEGLAAGLAGGGAVLVRVERGVVVVVGTGPGVVGRRGAVPDDPGRGVGLPDGRALVRRDRQGALGGDVQGRRDHLDAGAAVGGLLVQATVHGGLGLGEGKHSGGGA